MPQNGRGSRRGKRRTVGVVGLGVSGVAAATLLKSQGYKVIGFDQRALDDAQGSHVDKIVSESYPEDLARRIMELRPAFLVVSPGIPPSSPLISEPEAAGIKVVGEVQLAWDLSRGASQPNWLCVTGTNGKTTTVGMLASILDSAGIPSAAAGNVGYPITKAAFEGLEAMAVELSSFQLATAQDLRPVASICLNVDSDHLDWHGDRDAYVEAKAAIYNGTQVARFYFADEPDTQRMAQNAFEAQDSLLVPLTFSEVPAGAIGIADGTVVDRSGLPVPGSSGTTDSIVLANLAAIPLLSGAAGKNSGERDAMVRDALAAIALARAQGVGPVAIQQGLARFQPDAHRREPVGEFEGIRWINDSKATNVHAAIAAASSIPKGRLVWVMGGDSKGQDLRPLANAASTYAKAVVVIGASSEDLEELLADEAPGTLSIVVHGSGEPTEWMRDVVRACAGFADSGDTVLLAPGCASWDQFASYAERGSLFREAVKEMYAMKGE